MKVEDERGLEWVVKAGDPGMDYVRTLTKRGYRYIVLTRPMLFGTLEESVGVESAPSPPPSAIPPADNITIRMQRLHDCLEELS